MKLTILIVGLLTFSSLCFAAEKDLPQMPMIMKWSGPFNGTEIVKYADFGEGVACYVYAPTSVSTSRVYSGSTSGIQFNGGIGSISCVKVANTKSK